MKIYQSAFPYFSNQDIEEILLETKNMLNGKTMLSMGSNVTKFEKKFAKYCGVKYAVATNSCTSALNIIFKELKLDSKNEIIVPTQTFFANASSVINAGFKLKIIDTDNDFMCSYDIFKNSITKNTKAFVVVHFAGLITKDIFKIKKLCNEMGIILIEDCSHAHGAFAIDSEGKKYKAGSIGDIGVFSFFSTKIITCGEGGMIVSNDKDFILRCKARSNRGLDPRKKKQTFINFGENYRMAEFNAILGLKKLNNIETNIKYRNIIANNYKKFLCDFNNNNLIRYQVIEDGFRHSYWKFILFIKNINKQYILKELNKNGINAEAPYHPLLHKHPLIKSNKCINADKVARTHITLPIHEKITIEDCKFISHTLSKIIEQKKENI